eukprot:68082_1
MLINSYLISLLLFIQRIYLTNGDNAVDTHKINFNAVANGGSPFLNRLIQVVTVILLIVILMLVIVTTTSVIWFCCQQKEILDPKELSKITPQFSAIDEQKS